MTTARESVGAHVEVSKVDASNDLLLPCTSPAYTIVVALSNSSTAASACAFKCKTNAPLRWSVRPNGGVLEPGERLEVSFRLCGTDLSGLDADRHLILSAPIGRDTAQAETQGRRHQQRRHWNFLDLDTAGVSQHRLTPSFDVRPKSVMSSTPPASDPSAAGLSSPAAAAAVVGAMQSPCMQSPEPSPDARGRSSASMQNGHAATKVAASATAAAAAAAAAATATTATDDDDAESGGDGMSRHHLSVASRVAELDRLQQASSSSLMAAQAAIGGKNGSASGEDADDSDGTASVSAPHSGGIVHLLADWILRGREEFVPWLSWKVTSRARPLLVYQELIADAAPCAQPKGNNAASRALPCAVRTPARELWGGCRPLHSTVVAADGWHARLWLASQVYDILFALALIWLGRRVKLIRDAQEHGIL